MSDRPMIEVDIESTGIQWYASEVFLVQFLEPGGQPVLLDPVTDAAEVQRWLNKNVDFRAWNSKFDFFGLKAAGFELPPQDRWHDGMVAAHLLDERKSVALKAVAERMFGAGERDFEKAVKQWLKDENTRRRNAARADGEEFLPANYRDIPMELMEPYAAQDVVLTQRIGEMHYAALRANPQLWALYEMEMQVLGALFDMEGRGFPIDTEGVHRLDLATAERLDDLETRAKSIAGVKTFNPRSSKQIYEALERLGADLRFVTNKSMDSENISTVDHELASLIQEYRHELKVQQRVTSLLRPTWSASLQSYKQPFLVDGRIHPNFKQLGARTGRMSASDPNVQNFGRDDLRERYLVKAPEGMRLVTVDLDSIELKLFAAYAGEGRMLSAVLDPSRDMHTETADFLALQDFERSAGVVEKRRDRGKRMNYLQLYGGGQRALRKWFRVSSKEAQRMLEGYRDLYPEVNRLQDRIQWRLEDEGFVQSAYGRRFRSDQAWKEAYKFVNYVVQGTAADILKRSIATLHAQGVPLIGAVHDELIALVPEEDAEEVAVTIREALIDHPEITSKVPLEAEGAIVERWSDAKSPGWKPDHDKEMAHA